MTLPLKPCFVYPKDFLLLFELSDLLEPTLEIKGLGTVVTLLVAIAV